MDSIVEPEQADPVDMATSSSMAVHLQHDTTTLEPGNPSLENTTAAPKHVSNDGATLGPDRNLPHQDEEVNEQHPSQEAQGCSTTEHEHPPDDIPPHDPSGKRPFIWCRVELQNEKQWANCTLFQVSDEKKNLEIPVPLQDRTEASEGGNSHTDVSIQPPIPEVPHIGYSNRFIDPEDDVLVSEPWPEVLDLDRERGRLAWSTTQHDKPMIELVTIVRTNLSARDVNVYRFNHYDTRGVLSDPRSATDYVGKEVVIDSVRIIDAFKAIVTYYPGLELQGIKMTIPEPYCVFYHYFDEIKAFQRNCFASADHHVGDGETEPSPLGPSSRYHDVETRHHLEILCQVIEEQNLQEVELERERHRQNPPVATYRMLWLLFRPGTKVYDFSSGRTVVGIVQSTHVDTGVRRPGLRTVKFWNLDFDGFKLGRRSLQHDFKPFEGERRITELAVCPCDIYDAQDQQRLRGELVSRGKMLWRLLREPGAQVDYKGRLPTEGIEWVRSVPWPRRNPLFSDKVDRCLWILCSARTRHRRSSYLLQRRSGRRVRTRFPRRAATACHWQGSRRDVHPSKNEAQILHD